MGSVKTKNKKHLFLSVLHCSSDLILASHQPCISEMGLWRLPCWQEFSPRDYPQSTLCSWGYCGHTLSQKTWSLISWWFCSCPGQLLLFGDSGQFWQSAWRASVARVWEWRGANEQQHSSAFLEWGHRGCLREYFYRQTYNFSAQKSLQGLIELELWKDYFSEQALSWLCTTHHTPGRGSLGMRWIASKGICDPPHWTTQSRSCSTDCSASDMMNFLKRVRMGIPAFCRWHRQCIY